MWRMTKEAKHLFEQFRPTRYDLNIVLDKQAGTFSGKVNISGRKVGRPSKRLTFHQNGLKIKNAKITRSDKKGQTNIKVNRINTHARYHEVRLHSDEMLYPGDFVVHLEFSGKITQHMQGIYYCHFEHNGQKKSLLATQFESNHAREAFPCIDEPEAKAVFALTLSTPAKEITLSNTPIVKQSTRQGRTITVFADTPIMSSYLLAFVTGEMHAVEKKTKDGIVVKSWSSIAQDKKYLEYSANEAVRILEFYTDYFGVAYPLPKCDQVALPDFDAGAMENWGLITYREIALLSDPVNRSTANEQYISLVIAHELSHQWFGNLVTMKWWDDLWLNESFASIMEHIALDAIHPDWQQWEAYTASDVISTSSRDIYSNIQPVGVEVSDPDLLETLFDPGIVYAKGARLLKMLRDYIGDKAFKSGLRYYFKAHAYSNASRDDLWHCLTAASKRDIASIMTPWLTQSGMPVVKVKQTRDQILISQQRFLLDNKPDERLWPIPLLASQSLSPDLVSKVEETVTSENANWTIINQYASGHYITHYTMAAHNKALGRAIQHSNIPTESRINILNDNLLLAKRGDISLTSVLDIVNNCSHEPRESVWDLIIRTVGTAKQLTEGNKKTEVLLNDLKVKLATHWYEQLGWQDRNSEDSNTKLLRTSSIALMVSGEDNQANQEALRIYKNSKSITTINAEQRSVILGVAVRKSGKQVVERLLKEYPYATPDLQLDITSALGSTHNQLLAKTILEQALGRDGFVRQQDILRWLAVFLRNFYVRPVAWDFIERSWNWLEEVLIASKAFDYLPLYCSNVISTQEWADKYHSFFADKQHIKVLRQNIAVGEADIAARVAWRKRDEKHIITWLQKNVTPKRR